MVGCRPTSPGPSKVKLGVHEALLSGPSLKIERTHTFKDRIDSLSVALRVGTPRSLGGRGALRVWRGSATECAGFLCSGGITASWALSNTGP